MTMTTMEFDGVQYPDGDSSHPLDLGLMVGDPPPRDKRVLFEDDRFLDFPQIRWALSHMRQMVATVPVWRGEDAVHSLGAPDRSNESAIDALAIEDLNGQRLTWKETLPRTYTDGILVLHRGRCMYERYLGALQVHRPHSCFSITKSYAATLAATLVYERVLDEDKPVVHYLPEMAATAYADASLRTVLDMQVGVDYSEAYADPASHIWAYARAGGMRQGRLRGPALFVRVSADSAQAGRARCRICL
jgi:CubicO group peptidase (beta-lactamase class C family)